MVFSVQEQIRLLATRPNACPRCRYIAALEHAALRSKTHSTALATAVTLMRTVVPKTAHTFAKDQCYAAPTYPF